MERDGHRESQLHDELRRVRQYLSEVRDHAHSAVDVLQQMRSIAREQRKQSAEMRSHIRGEKNE